MHNMVQVANSRAEKQVILSSSYLSIVVVCKGLRPGSLHDVVWSEWIGQGKGMRLPPQREG